MTFVAYQWDEKTFFMYGFDKGERVNIGQIELKALKLLAREFLGYSDQLLVTVLDAGELIEAETDD